MTPRMHLVWAVLERAQDAQDASVIAACRRLIVANRKGWRTYASPDDWRLVKSFSE